MAEVISRYYTGLSSLAHWLTFSMDDPADILNVPLIVVRQQGQCKRKRCAFHMLLVASGWAFTACTFVLNAAPTAIPSAASLADPVEQGRAAYLRVCVECHGQNAEGHVVEPASALEHNEHAWHHPDQQLRDWIENGKLGFGQMPASGDHLSTEEIEAIIAYLHTLWTPEQLKTQQDITRRYGP